MLPPFGVFWRVKLDPGGSPRLCQVVFVIDEEVRRAGTAVVHMEYSVGVEDAFDPSASRSASRC